MQEMGRAGIEVQETGRAGFEVQETGRAGFEVQETGRAGFEVQETGRAGIEGKDFRVIILSRIVFHRSSPPTVTFYTPKCCKLQDDSFSAILGNRGGYGKPTAHAHVMMFDALPVGQTACRVRRQWSR